MPMIRFQKSSGVLGGTSYDSVNCWGDPVEDTPMHLWMISTLHLIIAGVSGPSEYCLIAGGACITHFSYPTHRPTLHDAWSSNHSPGYPSYSMRCPAPCRRLTYQPQFVPRAPPTTCNGIALSVVMMLGRPMAFVASSATLQ